ncbi:hypothetical protein ACVIIV_002991 [Bradyrhizobium sp. USDA 4354]
MVDGRLNNGDKKKFPRKVILGILNGELRDA